MKLKKNNIYISRIKVKAKEILDELGILQDGMFKHEIDKDILQKDCCKKRLFKRSISSRGFC